MSSYLTLKDGLYDPSKRFAFTNIDTEDFTFKWGGKPITVKKGQVVELPHHLAILATIELTDKIMLREVTDEERKVKAEKDNPYYRSPKATSYGVPEARKPYEDKILRELAPEEESPQLAVMRAQLREELENDMSKNKAEPVSKISVKPEEFSEVKRKK